MTDQVPSYSPDSCESGAIFLFVEYVFDLDQTLWMSSISIHSLVKTLRY